MLLFGLHLGVIALLGLLLRTSLKLLNELRIHNKLVKEQTALFDSITRSLEKFSIGLPCRSPAIAQNKLPKFKKSQQNRFS